MKYFLAIVSILYLISSSCCSEKKSAATPQLLTDSKYKVELPACIKKMLDDADNETPPNHPEKIEQYEFNNQKVYLVKAQCCDQFNIVYDSNCKKICTPSGGFTGRGDGSCTNFTSNAKLIKAIWPD